MEAEDRGALGGLVVFVTTAALLIFAAHVDGRLDAPPLGEEWRTMAGAGGPGSAALAAILPPDAPTWRATAAILIAAGLVGFGAALGRITGTRSALPALPLIAASHPNLFSALGRADCTTTACGLALCGLAAAMAVRPARRPPPGRWAALVPLGIASFIAPHTLIPLGLLVLVMGLVSQERPTFAWAAMAMGVMASFPLASGSLLDVSILCAPDPAPTVVSSGWMRRAAYAAPLVILISLGFIRRRTRDEPLLACGVVAIALGAVIASDEGGPAELLQDPHLSSVIALAFTASLGVVRAWPRRTERVMLIAAIALMLVTGRNSARLAESGLLPQRSRAHDLVRWVRDLPELSDAKVVDAILQAEPLGRDLRFAFPGRDVRAASDLLDPGEGCHLRLLRWGSKPGFLLRATRRARPHVILLAPKSGSARPAGGAADQPTFQWFTRADRDPGANAFRFAWVGLPSDATKRTFRSTPLDATMVTRERQGDRVIYSWRPSNRSQRTPHPSLYWEAGDLTRPGTHLSWTILTARRPPILTMAPPWRLHALP